MDIKTALTEVKDWAALHQQLVLYIVVFCVGFALGAVVL